MSEFSPKNNHETPYKVYEVLREEEPCEIVGVLGNYSVTINNRNPNELWIGASLFTRIDTERHDRQKFPDYIWKIHETEPPTFHEVRPNGFRYTGKYVATRIDELLIHVVNLVEQKQDNPGSDNPKIQDHYNDLMEKLIDHSHRRQPKRPDIWE